MTIEVEKKTRRRKLTIEMSNCENKIHILILIEIEKKGGENQKKTLKIRIALIKFDPN